MKENISASRIPPAADTMLQTGVPALLQWCRQVTADYPHVSVRDFTGSWRSGLGFCAIIARFRPDLIDFDSLDSGDGKSTCELAFNLAEKNLGIPALLDAQDMLDSKEMDSRSIITYLAQFYHKFNNLTPQPALRRSLEGGKTQEAKDSGLEDSLSDSRHSSPLPNSSRSSSPVSSSSRQSSSEDSRVKEVNLMEKTRSYQSLPRKEIDKPLPKNLGPKNLSFLAALKKFSNLSSSTPNLHRAAEDCNHPKKFPKHSDTDSRTTETQTDQVPLSHRAIQTDHRGPRAPGQGPETRLYARSSSISSLYSSGSQAVPNCDKRRANNIMQGLARYRGSQRIIHTPRAVNMNLHGSCDTLLMEPYHDPTQSNIAGAIKKKHACCANENWRLNETIGVYNTKHFEHNQNNCNQRYYEPNPLYGYGYNQNQGDLGATFGHQKKVWSSEAIYQNTGRRRREVAFSDPRILYNSKNQTFSTLV